MTPEKVYELASPKVEDLLEKIEVLGSRPNNDFYKKINFYATMGTIIKTFSALRAKAKNIIF